MSKAEIIGPECGQTITINGQIWCEEINRPLSEADGKPLCPSDCPVLVRRNADEPDPQE